MKHVPRILRFLLPLLLATVQLTAVAEDIDLFKDTDNTSSSSTTSPNMLLVIDNGSAFNSSVSGSSETAQSTCTVTANGTSFTNRLAGKVGGIEQCALYAVLNALDASSTDATATVNVGILMFATSTVYDKDGTDCRTLNNSNGVGGCLVFPIVPFSTANKTLLLNYVASWNTSNCNTANCLRIDGSDVRTGASMQEAWAYYAGKTGLSGRNYSGIVPNTNCKNFLVYVANAFRTTGKPKDTDQVKATFENTSATGVTSGMYALDGSTPPSTSYRNLITGTDRALTTKSCGTLNFPNTNGHESSGFYADEWSRWMKSTSLKITTFTVGLTKPGDCVPEYPWLLSSMADYGGGKYFEVNSYQELVDALQNILSEVRSVNSVFAAVSLPVSVNTQGSYLNQVFIGMFRPDSYFLPRWNGNLKQYKLGYDSGGALVMQDADDVTAISSSGSEFIAECARSFWTAAATSAGDGYFTTFTTQNCAPYPASANSPDGNIVEKGGQAYKLRAANHATRVVKTCDASIASCQTTMTDFNTSNAALTAAVMGVGTNTTPTATDLINWARGSNNLSEAGKDAAGNVLDSGDMRPSSHGDVVHSRPAAINMGTDANPKVVIFYGGNDGMLRAINGNRTTSFTVGSSTVTAGEEFWSFMPPEFLGNLYRLWKNNSAISDTAPKDYGADGPITVYRDAGENAWIYVGMRRGGRSLYAFYVDKTTLAITLKWKIGCSTTTMSDNSNCSATGSYGDYTNMGLTWSAPVVVKALGYANPVLIVGGGYDKTCEDPGYYTCSTTRGNQVYLIDAITGVLQKSLATQRSVVADVTTITDSNGYAKIIYTADMGGNLYRISGNTASNYIESSAPSTWTITRIASLGCSTLSGCTSSVANRKFMFAPDVVNETDDEYILLLGSGDREKPTKNDAYTNASLPKANNYFFMVKDKPKTSTWLTEDATAAKCLTGATMLCLNSLTFIEQGTTPSDSALGLTKGWYMSMNATACKTGSGTCYEQVVTGAIAAFGTVYFATHEPKDAATTSCVPNLGVSRAYAIRYKNASAAATSGDLFTSRDDAGLSPDLVVGKVTLDNGSTIPICIGCEGPIKPSVLVPGTSITNPAKIRSYWYIQK
jgi:type IV pilus assembly protein PilY1